VSNLVKTSKVMTLDSREIAEMGEITHSKLIRKLEGDSTHVGIIPTLAKAQLGVSDYFIKSSYKDKSGKTNSCYLFTKMGCEFIANKFTGEKGILFTAKYIERFNQMEQALKKPKKQLPTSESKQQLAEARLRNAKAREANILFKIADNPSLSNNYKQVLFSYASEIIADKPLIPLPVAEEKTYSAGEIGKVLGISANKVGRIANEHNLKTEQYGKLFHDKSQYSSKEVETFRYYESVVPVLKDILEKDILADSASIFDLPGMERLKSLHDKMEAK